MLFKFEEEFHQTEQPTLVSDLQPYAMIITLVRHVWIMYGLSNPNRITYVNSGNAKQM